MEGDPDESEETSTLKEDDSKETVAIHITGDSTGNTIRGEIRGPDIAVLDESDGNTDVSIDVSDVRKAVEKRGSGSMGIYGSHIGDNVDIAYVGGPGSIATIDQSVLSGDVADIIYHEDAELLIYDSIATQIMRFARGNHETILPEDIDTREDGGYPIDDPELYHMARGIVLADTPTEKHQLTRDLFGTMRDSGRTVLDLASRATDLQDAADLLDKLVVLVFSE